MENDSPETLHPTDLDLVELVLAREESAHVAACRRCAERVGVLARELDPSGGRPEPFDPFFYRRQARAIRDRIEPRHVLRWRPAVAWAGLAALTFLAAIGLRAPGGPLGTSGGGHAELAMDAEDLRDDRLLRDIDAILAEDPYDFVDLGGDPSTSEGGRSS